MFQLNLSEGICCVIHSNEQRIYQQLDRVLNLSMTSYHSLNIKVAAKNESSKITQFDPIDPNRRSSLLTFERDKRIRQRQLFLHTAPRFAK